MSHVGKLDADAVFGTDAAGKTKALSLGEGMSQSAGVLSAKVTWNTAFDIDMTTAVSCSYTTDGTATIADLNWELWNSTNIISVGIQPGVGLVFALGTASSEYPGYFTNITSPVLRLPITGVIPNWDFTQELRLWTQYELTGAVANYQGFRIGIGNNDFGTGDASSRPKLVYEDSRYYNSSYSGIVNAIDKTKWGNSSPFGEHQVITSNNYGIDVQHISGSMIHLRQQQQCDWYHFSMTPGETFDDASKRMVWTGQFMGYYTSQNASSIKPSDVIASSGMTERPDMIAILLAPINYGSQTAGHNVTIRRLRLDYR